MGSIITLPQYLLFGLIIIIIIQILIILRFYKKRSRGTDSIYLTLFKESFNPVLIMRNRKYVDANDAAIKFLGLNSRADLVMKHPMDISPRYQPDGKLSEEKSEEMLALARENGHHQFEWVHTHKSGSDLFVEVTLTAVTINGQKQIYVVWRDITKQKRVEHELLLSKEKAENSERLKSAFLESVSHEIRTPMNAIIGFSELLNLNNSSDEEKKQFVFYINKAASSLMLIVDNVIGVSNLKTSMSESFSTQIKLGELLDEVFTFIESETKMRNLEVVVDNKFQTDKTIMVSDAFRVKKTLYQLVLNSVKFTEKGQIKFGCNQNGKMLEFFVHDTGIGISETDKQEVFKLFRKGKFKKEKLYGGSGLGLSIAKASVEGMGGNISLESELDVGTKVKFWVPFDFEDN